MKITLSIFLLLISSLTFSQMNDCTDPITYGCSSSNFVFSSVGDDVDDFPAGSNSADCLASGDNQLIYLVLNANSNGLLEWMVQGDQNTGFLDWAIWPFDDSPGSTSCSDLFNGNLAPLACNWNMSNNGWAGMAAPGNIPAGADAGNFEAPINLVPGQTVLLGISNYSGSLDGQNITLTFFDTDLISCSPYANNQTVCEGSDADVTIVTPGFPNPTFNWLVTTGVSDVNGGTNVIVSTPVTTTYEVEVTQLPFGNMSLYVDTISFTISVEAMPQPNAGIDQSICLGDTIHLNGTANSTLNDIHWSFNTGSITPLPTVSFIPNADTTNTSVIVNQAGLYTFILEESNTICPAGVDTMLVDVQTTLQSITTINPICHSGATGEIHIDNGDAVSYSFDGGQNWQVDSFQVNLPAGDYIVCSQNQLGCDVCETVQLFNPDSVVVFVSNDTLICHNGTATLNANASGGTSYIYHWDMTNDLSSQQLVNPIVQTTYVVFAENELGCVSAEDSITVTLNDTLSGTITPNTTMCPGYPIDLHATASGGDGGPYNFLWDSGQANTGLTSTINVNPTTTRLYTVTISDNCETTPIDLEVMVKVATNPIPDFSVTENGICEPAVFEVVNHTDPNMVEHLTWIVSDGQTYNDQELIVTTPMQSGFYGVQLIVESPDGCIDSITKLNYLVSHPTPDVDFQYNPEPVYIFNPTVQLINFSSNAVSYEWFIESGSPNYSIKSDPFTEFPEGVPGVYLVTLVGQSEYGCLDTMKHEVIVLQEVLLFVPNAFTPNGDEFNNTWAIHVEGIDIYDYQCVVFDRWGKQVWTSEDVYDAWDGTFNGNLVPDGVYTWTIRTKDKVNDNAYTYNGHVSVIK
jgi:gliding motility-associated-like protein